MSVVPTAIRLFNATRNILYVEDIPNEIRELIQKLGDYCQPRIKHYNLLIKAINADDGSYDVQLEDMNVQSKALLEKM